jgi:hypothetical protein
VEDHIDSPFYKKIDAFAEKMRGLTIHNYTTANRIGSKETTYVGYGMSKQAVETDKAKVSVNDIFKDSESFDHVLSKEFEEFQINHPDIELSYEEYMKAIASSRGFEYESIGDVQKNQELWRDLLAGAGNIGAHHLLCTGRSHGGRRLRRSQYFERRNRKRLDDTTGVKHRRKG